jgi:hypothetical protein
MSLKGKFEGLEGRGTGGTWIGDLTEYFSATIVNQLRRALYLFAAGTFHRSVPIGGSKTRGLRFAGTIDAIDAVEFEIDNTSNAVSSSDGLHVPITVLVRVENASIAVTPRIYNVTQAAEATVTGAAACVAIADDYSGADQRQTLLLTLQTGLNVYKLQFTATDSTYQFWGQGWRSLYI